jgi:5-oxoprolinase (ATP-hydrolysing)
MEDFHGFKAVLSGPAGGVVGYARTTQTMMRDAQVASRPIIGFDMGGTSTDVSRVGVDGRFNHVYDTLCAGVMIQAPQLDINTVAAGGGSLLQYVGGLMTVGPESARAHPGPVCYRKNGKLAVTDANVVLGRVIPEFFPKIFGDNEDQMLDVEVSQGRCLLFDLPCFRCFLTLFLWAGGLSAPFPCWSVKGVPSGNASHLR